MRFVPGCEAKCCEAIPPPCGDCSGEDLGDTVPITLGNFTSDGSVPPWFECDCTVLNATYIASRVINGTILTPCLYRITGSTLCNYGYRRYYDLAAYTGLDSGTRKWYVVLYFVGGNYIVWVWDSGSADPFDCTATRILTVESYADSIRRNDCKDYANTTCQIN
jgi:hypothetical protein